MSIPRSFYVRIFICQLMTFCVAASGFGQDLPEGWQQLDTAAFVELSKSLRDAASLDEASLAAVRQNAKERLFVEGTLTTDNYYNINLLLDFSRPLLSPEQITEVEQLLATRQEAPGSLPFWEMQSRAEMMESLGTSRDEMIAFICQWCDADGQIIPEIEKKADDKLFEYRLRWLIDRNRLRHSTVNGRDFRVNWTGTITAPRTGNYRFSICPLNPSFENPAEGQHFRQSMRVIVDGQPLLDAKWNDWKHQGEAIALTAGKPVPIQVAYEHSRAVSTEPTSGIVCPSALLYWEGPGLKQSLVPTDALRSQNGNSQGLLATYEWSEANQMVSNAVIEARIDHLWLMGWCIVPPCPTQQAPAVAAAWERFSRPEYIQQCIQQRKRLPLLDAEWLAECFTHEQRMEIVDWAVAHPDLLNWQPWFNIEQFFLSFRYEAPEEALDVLGRDTVSPIL